MTDPGSITVWLDKLQSGDSAAAEQVWARFSEQLLRLVRQRLGDSSKRVADEEDVVAIAFASLFRRAKLGQFARLSDRHDLWRLLVTIADRKAINLRRDQRRLKRGGGRVAGESALKTGDSSNQAGWNNVAGMEPTPEFAAITAETLTGLFDLLDEALRQIVVFKLEGLTNDEIAARCDCSRVTVERQLKRIRTRWGTWEAAGESS